MGTNGAAGQAGNANFTADSAPGITVSAPNQSNPWGTPNFGSGTADVDLAKVYNSIRWAVFNSSDPASRTVNVSLANLIVGQTYKLQLLIGESVSAQRTFDIFVNGSQVADDFKPAVVQGSTALTKAGAAFVHQFTATSTTLSIVLDGSNVAQVKGLMPTRSSTASPWRACLPRMQASPT